MDLEEMEEMLKLVDAIINSLVDGFRDWAKDAKMSEILGFSEDFGSILRVVEASVDSYPWHDMITDDIKKHIAETVQFRVRDIIDHM